MVLVTYNLDVPDAPNNPSTDQPDMKVNTNAVNQILDTDHYSFNVNNGGTHKQITFPAKNAAGAQTDPASTLYTGSGTASTVADLNFRNQNGVFPLNIVRAAGVFTTVGTNGAVTLDMGFNVVSVTSSTSSGGGAGTLYTVALTSTVSTGTTAVCIVSPSQINGTEFSYTFTEDSLAITYRQSNTVSALAGKKISFEVIQI